MQDIKARADARSRASVAARRAGGYLAAFSLTGSRAYGTHHAESDYDFKGVYVADLQTITSMAGAQKTLTSTDHDDVTIYELAHFCKLAAAANPTVLEILWADNYWDSGEYRKLRRNRDIFLSKRVVQTYGGYAVSQLRKAREGTGGSRGQSHHKREKFKLHTLRLLRAGQHALATGELMVRLPEGEVDVLRAQAALPMEQFETVVKLADDALRATADASPLPDQPDEGAINELIWSLRGV